MAKLVETAVLNSPSTLVLSGTMYTVQAIATCLASPTWCIWRQLLERLAVGGLLLLFLLR